MKAKQDPKKVAPKQEISVGATVEEIDDEEAKKIEALQALQKKQQELKKKKEDGGDKEEDKKEEESSKQAPNHGNGGETDKYVWHQTLEEITCFFPLPMATKANMLDVKIGISNIKISYKNKPNEPALLEGKWHKKINSSESFWNIERDGEKVTMNITLEKSEGKNWWNCLLQGDIEIDTQKVEPENSKLSDLDGETRSTVEKMMYDQQ